MPQTPAAQTPAELFNEILSQARTHIALVRHLIPETFRPTKVRQDTGTFLAGTVALCVTEGPVHIGIMRPEDNAQALPEPHQYFMVMYDERVGDVIHVSRSTSDTEPEITFNDGLTAFKGLPSPWSDAPAGA